MHASLERQRHFRENKKDLDEVMEFTADILFEPKTEIKLLTLFQDKCFSRFPHKQLPFFTDDKTSNDRNNDRRQMRAFQKRDAEDCMNENKYACVMVAFMDTMLSKMRTDNVPARELAAYERYSLSLLAS